MDPFGIPSLVLFAHNMLLAFLSKLQVGPSLLKYILEEDMWENLNTSTSYMQPKGHKFLHLQLENLKVLSRALSLEADF